ncbi:hypothetical protein E2N92_01495 [Methanofollis formosanus]|uniref:Uncharacterized protein n=1 Tax=Methanofollis formosanus TaxID=299308 RepID=A0A8G1EFJ9_9EURY|nr:hypothetical protein [Methanofollis formosanus]QYZ78196.1 hypothetical protein E2N92_01495 [Methanofollis formosanus]
MATDLLENQVGKPVKVTYSDDGEIRVLRGTVVRCFGFVELELPDGHHFLVNLAKIDRILEIDEDRLSRRRDQPTVID